MYKESVQEDDLTNLNYLFNNGPFIIEPLYQIIAANSKAIITVTLVSEDPGIYEEFLEVITSLGDTKLIRSTANV